MAVRLEFGSMLWRMLMNRETDRLGFQRVLWVEFHLVIICHFYVWMQKLPMHGQYRMYPFVSMVVAGDREMHENNWIITMKTKERHMMQIEYSRFSIAIRIWDKIGKKSRDYMKFKIWPPDNALVYFGFRWKESNINYPEMLTRHWSSELVYLH